jgi:hypothetical protein
MHLVMTGGSGAGDQRGAAGPELDPAAEVTVVLADAYPNFSVCGIPYCVSGEVGHWRLPGPGGRGPSRSVLPPEPLPPIRARRSRAGPIRCGRSARSPAARSARLTRAGTRRFSWSARW